MSEARFSLTLLYATPEPQLAAALGARLCYSDSSIAELKEELEPKAEALVERLMSYGHLSPVEHASFTFGVEGVSRALLCQLTRHRIASFSVQSQRYVASEDGTSYILPPSIRALGEEAVREYEAQMETINGFYAHWLKRGISAEDARFLLPNAAQTRLILTMNARELLHFFSLRACKRAQWEIRRLAWAMLGIAKREAPALFRDAGPACVGGACTEGKMSCKESEKVKRLYAELSSLADAKADDASIVQWVTERIGNAGKE